MKKSLLKDVLERAEINNIRINFFYFIVEVYRDVVKYRFCYDFNYNDNSEENDSYIIADDVQSDDFEVSRIQFLEMVTELEKMPCYGFKQITRLYNDKYRETLNLRSYIK